MEYFCRPILEEYLNFLNMNFELTEEHRAVQEAARDFTQSVLLPGVIERDRERGTVFFSSLQY